MLGVALGSLGWEGVAKTGSAELVFIESLDVSTCHFTERSIGSQSDLSKLAEIRLDYLKIGDAELRLLTRFPLLQTIWLTGTDITDGGLRELQSLAHVSNVVLKSTRVTDQGLANMGTLPSLVGLNLPAAITDAGVLHLKSFPNLRRLDLSYSKITDEGLKALHAVPSLTDLYLNDTAITDDGLKTLAGLTSLQTLFLSGTKVSDVGLNHLDNTANLVHLELRDTKCTEIGVARVRNKLPNVPPASSRHIRWRTRFGRECATPNTVPQSEAATARITTDGHIHRITFPMPAGSRRYKAACRLGAGGTKLHAGWEPAVQSCMPTRSAVLLTFSCACSRLLSFRLSLCSL
jgi:hypothetical protein